MNILYVAPLGKQRTGLTKYSKVFEDVIQGESGNQNINFIRFQKDPVPESLLSLRSVRGVVGSISIEPDLIHGEMSSSTYFEFWYTYFLSKKFKNTPLVLTIHDSPFVCLNPFHGFFKKGYQDNFFLRAVRGVLDNSIGRLAEKYLVKRAGYIFVTTKKGTKLFSDRFKAINTGYLPHVPLMPEHGVQRKDKGDIILFNGFVIPGKGVEVLLRAFRKMKDRRSNLYGGVRLVICGSYDEGSKYFQKLLKLADELGVAEKVEFTGYTSEDELRHFMERAVCMVLPYFSKKTFSSSGVLIRAMSCGVTVLVSDIEMFLEYVKNGINGLVFKEGDSEDLFLKLGDLVEDSAMREKLLQGAFQYVERKHDNKNIAKDVIEVYEKLILKERCE